MLGNSPPYLEENKEGLKLIKTYFDNSYSFCIFGPLCCCLWKMASYNLVLFSWFFANLFSIHIFQCPLYPEDTPKISLQIVRNNERRGMRLFLYPFITEGSFKDHSAHSTMVIVALLQSCIPFYIDFFFLFHLSASLLRVFIRLPLLTLAVYCKYYFSCLLTLSLSLPCM